MNNKLTKAVLGGVVGTIVMTVIILIGPMMGMPKMSPPAMLAGMMGMPIFVGWMMHFIIGIVFALAYTFLLAPKVKIANLFIKGGVFGIIVFVFAQIVMAIMGGPKPEGSMMMLMMGSVIGHIIYGIGVAKMVGE